MQLITSISQFKEVATKYEKVLELLSKIDPTTEEPATLRALNALYDDSAKSAEILRNSLVNYSSFSKLCKDFIVRLINKDPDYMREQVETFTKKIGYYSLALGIDDLPELFQYALTIYTQYYLRLEGFVELEALKNSFFKTSCSDETLLRYKKLSESIQKELLNAPPMDEIIDIIDTLIKARLPQTPAENEEEIIYEEEIIDSADVKGKGKSTYVPIKVQSKPKVEVLPVVQSEDDELELAKKLSLMNTPHNYYSEDGESDSPEAPVTQYRKHSTNKTTAHPTKGTGEHSTNNTSAHHTQGTREHSTNNTSAHVIRRFFELGNEEMSASYMQLNGALNKYTELYRNSLGTQQSTFFAYQSSSFNELNQLGETLINLLKPENSLYSICRAHILSCLYLDPQNVEKHISNFVNRIAALPVFKGDLNLIQLMVHTMYTYKACLLGEPSNYEKLVFSYAEGSKEKLLQFKAIYKQLCKDFDTSDDLKDTLFEIGLLITLHDVNNIMSASAYSKDIKESSSTPVNTSLANNRNSSFSYRLPTNQDTRDTSKDFWNRPK